MNPPVIVKLHRQQCASNWTRAGHTYPLIERWKIVECVELSPYARDSRVECVRGRIALGFEEFGDCDHAEVFVHALRDKTLAFLANTSLVVASRTNRLPLDDRLE